MDVQALKDKPEPLPLRTLDESAQADLANILPMLDRSLLMLPSGDQLALKARALKEADISESAYWLTGTKGQPALRFVQWNGTPVITHPERISAAASLLMDADIVLSALELKLGIGLEPDHISDRKPEAGQLIELDFYSGSVLLHRVWLGFPVGFALPVDPTTESLNTVHVPVVVTLQPVVASLDIDDASAIATGDLLILRGGNWQTKLETPFGAVDGQLDPHANQFSIANGGTMPKGKTIQGQSMTSDDNGGEGGGFGALRVPVSMRLPDQSMTIEELGKLRAGLAVPVGQVTAGVQVELLVAGRLIAKGELVRLGEQFAVHIDTLPQQELPPAAGDGDAIELPDESAGDESAGTAPQHHDTGY